MFTLCYKLNPNYNFMYSVKGLCKLSRQNSILCLKKV